MSEQNNNNKSKILLLILLLLSLGGNGYLYNMLTGEKENNANLSSQIKDLNTRVNSLEATEDNLNTEIDETIAELDEYKGLSANLDSLLEVAKKDISAKQSRIRKLKKESAGKKVLEKEIAALMAIKENYLNQVDSLIQANGLLQEQVVQYQADVQQLQNTVQKGSILSSDNINIIAYKEKKNGKFVSTIIASKTSKLEICFDLQENKIADSGEKDVYLRVISPEGTTLGGSGDSFTSADDSTKKRFTTKGLASYQNQKKNYCIDYPQETAFQKGNYQVEVYADGHFAGVGAFILK